MNLSPHFTLAEMTVSQTASRRGLDNTPNQTQVAALTALCVQVLEKVRAHYGKPVIVTSGYRSVVVNKAIGGSATSQHCVGEAADFTVQGHSNLEVCKWIRDNLQFDQLIYEFGESGWVHCSFSTTRKRMDVLSAKRLSRKVKYMAGLVP